MGISNLHSVHNQQHVNVADDPVKKQKLQKAVREFEALFVNYMLKAMKQTVNRTKFDDGGFGSDLYDDLFTVEVAKAISKNGSFGIAETLYRKITGENLRSLPLETEALLQLRSNKIKFADSVKAQQQVQSVGVKPSLTERINRYHSIIEEAAQNYGIDSTLIKAIIATESAGNPRAQSAKQAKGLMQLIDSTAAEMGVKNVWDPSENINGGTKYLKYLLEQFDGNIPLALASYNAGPARVIKHNGIPPIRETQSYVTKVLQIWKHFQQMEGLNNED